MNATEPANAGNSTPPPGGSSSSPPKPAPRLWPGVLLVALFWGLVLGLRFADPAISTSFISTMAASALLGLGFGIWWLSNRRISWVSRLSGLAAMVLGGVVAYVLSDPSVGGLGLMLFGVPMALSGWVAWLLVSRNRSESTQRLGQVVVVALVWASMTLVRVDGIDGDNNAAVALRWAPSAEEVYLAERAKTASVSTEPAADERPDGPRELQPGDWGEFRGPNREGVLRGVKIATDWNEHPPKQLWRQRIGPAWSSVLIIGERLITQEQRGENEVVVCLDTATGREIWSHADHVRYSDGQAGAGPRATPTFSAGQIYSLGGTGILNCLDAASGKPKWKREVAVDCAAPLPLWGFSSSPLVAGGLVVVFAGGEPKGLAAYRSDTGEPAWTAPTGEISYSSPQLASVAGQSQILFFGMRGLSAFEPETGEVAWQYDAPTGGTWRVVQPRQIDDDAFLIGSEDLGLLRLQVSSGEPTASPQALWTTRAMRPAFNDLVSHDGFIYGFDEAIFCCLDAKTGQRRWKGGRYGHGQVLLLADQPLLVVTTEAGEAVLVAANPDKHEELGRFQAVKGKTWNHPVIAHGRLFVRNDEEIACFEVGVRE